MGAMVMESAGAGIPLNPGVPGVSKDVAIPPEAPDIGARSLYVAGRLLAGAATFFFLAYLFAYFYLRSLNENGMWKPAHVKPDATLGAVIVVCLLASSLAAIWARVQLKRDARPWIWGATLALALGLAAVVVQCVQYSSAHFGPTNGGYASVFCAWTGVYAVAVLATMYWLETQVATELRARRNPASRQGDIAEADRLIEPGLDAAVFFWSYLVGIGVITWVTLYLV